MGRGRTEPGRGRGGGRGGGLADGQSDGHAGRRGGWSQGCTTPRKDSQNTVKQNSKDSVVTSDVQNFPSVRRIREVSGILVKSREKIKRSFWNSLYLEKYYRQPNLPTSWLSSLLLSPPTPPHHSNPSTHHAITTKISTLNSKAKAKAQGAQNRNLTKGYSHWGFTNWATHTDPRLVKPGCLLIGSTLT